MTDIELLTVCFLVLYALQSLRLVPADFLLLQRNFFGGWKITTPSFRIRSGNVSVIWINPLLPPGECFAVRPLPFSLSPEGLAAIAPSGISSDDQTAPQVVSTQQLASLSFDNTIASVDNRQLFGCIHSSGAQRYVAELGHFASIPSAAQTDEAFRLICTHFDESECKQAIDYSQKVTRLLRYASYLFFLSLLIFLLLWDLIGLNAARWVLASTALFWSISIAGFWRATECLFPGSTRIRLWSTIEAILYPISVMRAADALSLAVIERYHPAVAISAIYPPLAPTIAGKYLRYLKYPLPSRIASDSPVSAILQFATKQYAEAFDAWMKRCGIDSQELLTKGKPVTGTFGAYCPRCLTTYADLRETCADCTDVRLIPGNTQKKD